MINHKILLAKSIGKHYITNIFILIRSLVEKFLSFHDLI